jgi:hypothetical protein
VPWADSPLHKAYDFSNPLGAITKIDYNLRASTEWLLHTQGFPNVVP